MKVGYIRVSTNDQNLSRQEDLMQELGVEKIYREKASGKNTQRPELQKMLDYVREGDSIVVESISRLARSTSDLLAIVERLKQKEVSLVSHKESIDTNTPQGKFVLTLFGALAELERESILQRQKEGIESAKERGTDFGRPKFQKPDNWNAVIRRWENKEIKTVDAIRELKIPKATFYKYATTPLE